MTFNAEDEALVGDIIICDSTSSLDLRLTNSTMSGAINTAGIDCTASLVIGSGSTWTVTGDSYLSSLTNNGTIDGTGKVYVDGTRVY